MIQNILSRENPKHCWYDMQDVVKGRVHFKPEVSGLEDLRMLLNNSSVIFFSFSNKHITHNLPS